MTSSGDILIKNCSIVDVIHKKILRNQDIRIGNGRIISISNTSGGRPAMNSIDGSNLIVLPGFIDTHTHLWQHIGKSMFPKESLQKWTGVYREIHPLDSMELYDVVTAACKEALLSGITTVCDYASLSFNDYDFESNANAIKNAGMGGVLVWNNPSVFLPDNIKSQEIEKLSIKYKNHFSIWMGPGPFSFNTIPQVYSGIVIAQKLHMHITEHTMENMQEQRDFYNSTASYLANYGPQLDSLDRSMLESLIQMKRPSEVDAYERLIQDKSRILFLDSLLQPNGEAKKLSSSELQVLRTLPDYRYISPLPLFEYFGALNEFLAIHAVWLQKEDILIAKKYNVSVSHNPESNAYLESGMAPVYEYLNAGIPISLGTDGAASNDGINFFTAMRTMWNVYKLRLLNVDISKNIDPWEIIQSATINGARALHLDSVTGSIEVGKLADLVLIATNELGMSPMRDSTTVPLMIYSADTRNVKYVISKGKILVREGHLIQPNENKISLRLTAIAQLADKKIANGKLWVDLYTLNAKQFENYWYKYRSIRPKDSVNVTVTNKSKSLVRFSVMGSGTVFGGGTPVVVDSEVQKRFPFVQESSFSQSIMVKPGESLNIVKPRGSFRIQIISKSSTFTNLTKSGQLLLLAQRQ